MNIYKHPSANIVLTSLLASTKTNQKGKWTSVVKSPKNDHYFLTAIISTANYRGTSNTVIIKMNYDFTGKALSIDSHKNNSSTHRKQIILSGKSPNGTLKLYIDGSLKHEINVSNNIWAQRVNLPSEKTFKVQAKIIHNELEKVSDIVNISRNSKPKVTRTSGKKVVKNKFNLTGIGKEKTLLTITMVENSLTMMTKSLQTLAASKKEVVIGQVTTNENGEWNIDIPISASGTYSFKIYENFGTSTQVESENYNYDLALENNQISLNLAPSPFKPSKETLKIEYLLIENSNIDIGIYSITGFKVYGKSISGGNIGAMTGRNILVWDGKSNGNYVVPGLYIVILKVNGKDNIIKSQRVGIKW